MRILFGVEFYAPSVGGAQEVVRQLAERMCQKGHDVSVATTRLESRKARIINGVSVVEFDISGNLVRGLSGEIERYQQFVLENTFDVVMIYAAQQWTFDALWPVVSKISAKKILVPCGYSGLYLPSFKDYFDQLPRILHDFDLLIYHAEKYRDVEFGERHGLSKKAIVPNGADVCEFAELPKERFRHSYAIHPDAHLILTVGSMTGTKGHREVLAAFMDADFHGKDTTLILNGNNPYHGILNDGGFKSIYTACKQGWGVYNNHGFIYLIRHLVKVALLKIFSRRSQYVPHLGYVKQFPSPHKRVLVLDLPRSALVAAFKESDLFVFASNVEYSPLVLFEACAASLPFLTVPVGNAEEIVAWTGGGELCEAHVDDKGFTQVDPQVLARRMEAMLAQPEHLRALGEQGHKAAVERFNWDNLAKEYETLFEQVLNQPRGSTETLRSGG